MHPDFRRLVEEARSLGAHVIDRRNLAEHRVEVVASLPRYLAENTGVGPARRRAIRNDKAAPVVQTTETVTAPTQGPKIAPAAGVKGEAGTRHTTATT